MIRMMKIMRKKKKKIRRRRKIIKNIKKQKTNTIPTNKTLGTDNTLTGEERKKSYLLYLKYEKTTLSNMQRKFHVH